MTTDVVLVTVDVGVMTITLNRPDKRNAVNREVAELVSAAIDRFDGDPQIRAAVITGAGDHFCAGMDLEAFARGERARSEGRGFAGIVEGPPLKPLVGAVEGWALGGGMEILLCCDLVVASETAKFGLPEVKRGLVARGGGAMRVARILPRPIAMELLVVGEPMTAAQAHHFGLVNHVAPAGGALSMAEELAAKIAQNAPLATAASKRIVDESAGWAPEEAFDRQSEILDPVFASDDAKEGAAAFKERRAPEWAGR